MACDPTYLVALFNGLPFEIEETEDTFGRRGVQYEYPYQDSPFYIDLGRRARKFTIKGYVIGENHVAQANAIVSVAESEGPKVFTHPTLGVIRVAVEELKVTVKYKEKRRYTELEFTLLEAPIFGGSVVTSVIGQLLASVVGMSTQTNASLVSAWDTAQGEQTLLESDVDYVLTTLLPVKQQLALTNTVESNDWLDRYEQLTLTPSLGFFSDTIVSLLGGLELVPSVQPETYKAIATGAAGTIVATGSRAEALTSYNAALRLQASGYVAETASNTKYTYLQQAYTDVDWLDRVLSEEGYIASMRCDDAVFRSIQDFSSAAYTSVLQTNIQLPGIVRRDGGAQRPSLVVAQQLFGDAKRAEELESLNPLHNPLALGGQTGYWSLLR